MKKLLSLIICLCIFASTVPAMADEVYIELDSLRYDEYMRGETIFISGQTNTYVSVALYYPEGYSSTPKFVLPYSPDELADGIEIETGTEEVLWPDGVWTIRVQSGEASEVLEFTLCETVDRTEDPSDDGASKPNGNKPSNNGTTEVVLITPEKTELTLPSGTSEKISIKTSSSIKVEIEDEDVVSASLSGKTLTVTGLKKGTSDIWLRSSSTYAAIHVTVTPAVITEPEPPKEEPTEKPTENTTEKPQEPVNPFTDLKDSHWAKNSILTLYSKGIINGMTETTFAPDESVTRAQFVTMLAKAFGIESAIAVSPFDDVSAKDWYFKSVMASYEHGISTGYGGKFNPNSLVTRQDMATFAYRAAKAAGIKFATTSQDFADHELISGYAIEAVYSMRSVGVINGMTATTFEPSGNATRAQAAHIIAKLLELD